MTISTISFTLSKCRSAQNLRRAVLVVVIILCIIVFTRHSFGFRDEPFPTVLPPCPPKIPNDDFSPTAIRCRIRSAQDHIQYIATQSSTPEEAAEEYKRRYRRNPPRGFATWVQFALKHGSQIIDDFDQIEQDLKPYRTPEAQQIFRVFNSRSGDWPRTRRITISNGSMQASADYMYSNEWDKLLKPFVHALPDSVFYMSLIDEPRILSQTRRHSLQIDFHERSRESISDLVKESCSKMPLELTSRSGLEKDVCLYSDPGRYHGLISSPTTFSYTHSLVPILSFGRMSAFRDILIPCPCYAIHPLLPDDTTPFLDKIPKVYWRGSSTGAQASRFTWKYGHRERLVSFVQSLQDTASVLERSQYFGMKLDSLDVEQIKLFQDVFDIRMGSYIQCDQDTCEEMKYNLGLSDVEDEKISLGYRFLYDIDGNSMSTRFYRLLSQRAVVLKQTWFQEWHDDRLIPWAHYIPVTMTMEELPSLLNFLLNDPEGEVLSAEIAESAYIWSHKALREIDMSIYIYRLLLEIADLYNPMVNGE
jgi:Glycosyl transferase family 90